MEHSNRHLKNLLLNISLSLLIFIVLFIFCEIAGNIYLVYFAPEKTFLTYASYRQLRKRQVNSKPLYSPHRYLGYYPTPNYVHGLNRHNSLGYRGDEIKVPKGRNEFRIVCIGGSTTYTSHIENYKLSYPFLLQEELRKRNYKNVTVINAGASGWSSWESLINFELRVLDLDPDMIIIYHAINDINARMVWPPAAYKGDNSGRRGSLSSGMLMPGLLEHSTIIRFFLIRAGIIAPHSSFENTVDKPLSTYVGWEFDKQKKAGKYPQGIFINVPALKILSENTPKYFERNIRNIVRIATGEGITTVISSFAYSPLFKNEPRVSSDEYISAFKEMNSILKKIAGDMQVNYFDFATMFPVDKRYYIDGRHVNAEGSRLKAKLFADYLLDNKLIPHSGK
jgi:lysophospholipase L1-like esterase